jgi:hypothetical protein
VSSAASTAGPGQDADQPAHEARVAELRAAMPAWLDAASGFKPAPSRNPSLPSLVGLLILILCFFVVLTSISLRDKNREQTVIASLSQAFSETGLAPAAAERSDEGTRKLLGDLRTQLQGEVPLVTGVAAETADDYTLALPRRLVFGDDGVTLASGFGGIVEQAMRALRSGPADFAYEIEVGISTPQVDDKAIAGATAVAAALRDAGVANDAASVSLLQGGGDTVSLTIRLRPNARIDPAARP